jgi:LPXTG-motif cell wall-anchored protein
VVSDNNLTDPSGATPAVEDSVLGTVITNTTPSDEVEAVEVLPFTGSESDKLLILAASAMALGGILLISARREEA